MTKKKFILIVFIVGCLLSVMAINKMVDKGKSDISNKYYSDSLFIVYTVKEYSKRDWYSFHNYARMYRITNDEITFFVESIFYSPDKKKLIAWVGKKMYNAPTIEKYSNDETANRICPLERDTVFHFTVLIGYKDNDTSLFKLFPWGNRQVPCSSTKNIGVKELEQYYFKDIKRDYFEVVGQSGKSKGIVRNQPYQYAINDKEFWSTFLWQRDTVGTTNKYPFEVKYYRLLTDTCLKCAEEMKLPHINYPDSLIAH